MLVQKKQLFQEMSKSKNIRSEVVQFFFTFCLSSLCDPFSFSFRPSLERFFLLSIELERGRERVCVCVWVGECMQEREKREKMRVIFCFPLTDRPTCPLRRETASLAPEFHFFLLEDALGLSKSGNVVHPELCVLSGSIRLNPVQFQLWVGCHRLRRDQFDSRLLLFCYVFLVYQPQTLDQWGLKDCLFRKRKQVLEKSQT